MIAQGRVVRAEAVRSTAAPMVELSGLACDPRGGVWTHNDSGDIARVFFCPPDGGPAVEYRYRGLTAFDWEDIGIGRSPIAGDSSPWLWVDDTGSARPRGAAMSMIGTPLPADPYAGGDIGSDARQSFPFRASTLVDVEAVFESWSSGSYAVSKRTRDGRADVWHLPIRSGVVIPEPVGTVPVMLATAADMSRDGSVLVIRNYTHAYFWLRRPAERTVTMIGRDPDYVVRDNAGAEAISIEQVTGDGVTYWSVAEGTRSRFWRRTTAWSA